jgi:hypothetical protein
MVDGIALRHCLFNLLHLTDLGIELKKISLNLQNPGASNGGCMPRNQNFQIITIILPL